MPARAAPGGGGFFARTSARTPTAGKQGLDQSPVRPLSRRQRQICRTLCISLVGLDLAKIKSETGPIEKTSRLQPRRDRRRLNLCRGHHRLRLHHDDNAGRCHEPVAQLLQDHRSRPDYLTDIKDADAHFLRRRF